MQLTSRMLRARAEALEEAAGHLELNWTDDPVKLAAGLFIGRRLRADSRSYLLRAIEREQQEKSL